MQGEEPESSRVDQFLTQTLKTALALIDVRVLDPPGGGQCGRDLAPSTG